MDKRLGYRTAWLAAAAAVLSFGAILGLARPDPQLPAGGSLTMFAGIPPTAYLVERIGGRHVDVRVLVRPGQTPHTFEPTPGQMSALGRARLFFRVGIPFEDRLVEKIRGAGGRLTIVDTAEGIQKRMLGPHCCDHADQGHHHHHNAQPDPHVWLSPQLLKIQAANVAEALQRADPARAAEYRRNLTGLLEELDAVDAKIAAALKPYRGQSFYVFHPAFGYFGDAYGLKQVAVEAEGKPPTPRRLRALIERAKADGVKIIFLQPQFDQQNARVVAAAIGGAVVPIDPLVADVPANLEDMAMKIERAMHK